MADVVERFTVDELLSPHASARVMRPDLRSVELHWHVGSPGTELEFAL